MESSKCFTVNRQRPPGRIRFVIYSAFLLVLISSDLIVCKSIPFNEKELDNLSDCRKPIRTSAQLVLGAPGKRRLTFTQLLIRKMLRTMIRRKSLPLAFLEKTPIRRKRRQRKPVKFRPRRPEFENWKTKIDWVSQCWWFAICLSFKFRKMKMWKHRRSMARLAEISGWGFRLRVFCW